MGGCAWVWACLWLINPTDVPLDGCVYMPMVDKTHRVSVAWVCMSMGISMVDKPHRCAVAGVCMGVGMPMVDNT